jgi:hypothetical protein
VKLCNGSFQWIAITDDRVTDVYPVYAEALRWYWRPQPDKFELQLNTNAELWLVAGGPADA